MRKLLTFGAVLFCAALSPAIAEPDDTAMLPLGDPARAFILASGEPGAFIDCRDLQGKKEGDFDRMIGDLAGADVVIIGEQHTSLAGHRAQWKVFDALAATGTNLILGMEFFDSTQDAALAKFADGKSDVDGLLAETDWYGAGNYSFEYYRPMFETARKRGFRIVGLNVPRQLVRAASKADSSGLSPEQRSLVGELGPIDARHEYMVDRMMGALGASMPDAFAGMYRGQTVWDSAMATSIVRAAHNEKSGAKATIVVIVGSGHMAHGLAIPARLASIQPGLKVRTLAPVEAVRPDPKVPVHPGLKASETATFSRGLADYVYVLPDEGGEEAYPRPGVRLEQAKEGPEAGAPRVASVAPGGLMERAGLAPGDIVRRIAGSAPASLSEARRLFAGMRWGDRTIIDVQRSGKDVALPVLVVPPTDGDEDWLKSREPVCVAPGFNPVSDGSFADPPPRAAGRAARIVRFRDKPVRIDVLDGKRLVEAWKLDESGRVSEGLTADPSADGAVRIVYERDPSGTVTAERRFDPDRREIRK